MERFVLVLCVFITCSFAFGGEYVVDPNGSMDFTTIQSAIDDEGTVEGDVIIVVPGTYYENINLSGKAITLQSVDPLDAAIISSTIIDGNDLGSVITCDSGEAPDTVIDGFVITNGTGSMLSGSYYGGGILVNNASSPTISNCSIIGNAAKYGAGMFSYGSSAPVLNNCVFVGNSAVTYGGGIYINNSTPVITDCKFITNTAGTNGGGFYISNSSPTITGSQITGNLAQKGGGIYNNSAYPGIIACSLTANTASASGTGGTGGGIHNASSAPQITECTFSGNTASYIGGGINNVNSLAIVTDSYFCFNAPQAISGSIAASSDGNNMDFCASPKEPEAPVPAEGDLTGDGKVDMADLAELAANWLNGV